MRSGPMTCQRRWELYRDDLIWIGPNSDSAGSRARELRMREHNMNELIEKEAVSIGLWSTFSMLRFLLQ